MRLFLASLLVTLLLPGLATAQTTSQSSAAPTDNQKRPATAADEAKPAAAPVDNSQTPATPADNEEPTGLLGFVQFQSGFTTLGAVLCADIDLGYQLTPHLAGDAGLPVFFVRNPYSPTTNHDWIWTNLLADPYLDVRYTTTRSGASLTSILTGTIPVAGNHSIYNTARFGVDWFNHIDHAYGSLTPFLNFGAANGTINRFIMPRPYSDGRPYQTFGFISDFEGGATYTLRRRFKLGVSGYALVPAGPQKVYSRLVAPDNPVVGDGNHNRVFTSSFLTIGPHSIATDNGFSAWLEISRLNYLPHLSVQVGYTRSTHYHYDAYTVVLNFDYSSLLRGSGPTK